MRVLDELPKTRSQPSLEAWVREDDRQTPVGTDRAWRLLFSTTIQSLASAAYQERPQLMGQHCAASHRHGTKEQWLRL